MSIVRFAAKSQDYLQDIEIKTCVSIDKKLIFPNNNYVLPLVRHGYIIH